MGLPLYQAPVESDLKGKPAPKSPTSRARSAIRRSSSSRRLAVPTRPPRHRLSPLSGWISLDVLERAASPPQGEPDGGAAAARAALSADYRMERMRAIRDMVGEYGMTNDRDRTAGVFGARFAHLYAAPSDRPTSGTSTPSEDRESRSPAQGRDSRSSSQNPVPRQSQARGLGPGEIMPASAAHRPGSGRVGAISMAPRPAHGMRRRDMRSLPTSARGPTVAELMASSDLSSRADLLADGLGDRDRSLSPEGDGIWDTMLSSITPDPQPPSVGSSFASTSAASAAASQPTSATGSSRTSMTGPADFAELHSALDHPCDSGCEHSDTDGDEEDEDEEPRNPLTRFAPARRSYADVTRPSGTDDDDPLEALGGREVVQHILRTLSRRDDIPDAWWAGVGLSRRLSDEPN